MIILNFHDFDLVGKTYNLINEKNVDVNDLIVNIYNNNFINKKIPYRINNFILNQDLSEEVDIDDLLLKIKEKNIKLIIKNKELMSEKFIKNFIEACEYYDVVTNDKFFDFDKKIDLKNMEENDWAIILEIFQESLLLSNNYLVGKTISNIHLYENHVNINGTNFNELNSSNMYHDFEIVIPNELIKSNFNLNFYTNDIYNDFSSGESLIKNVLDYKFRVFDAIKNIDPEQYLNINKELSYYLFVNNYIQIKDIKEILVGDDIGNRI